MEHICLIYHLICNLIYKLNLLKLIMLEENISYIEKLKRFGIKYTLDNMERLCFKLGDPHKKFKSIHVGGTNGKGSTSNLIANILKESGYKVGLYTSPYVNKFNERIQINNISISDEELDLLIIRIREIVEENEIDTSFFDFTTALAFLYFADKGIEVGVIEVGMGGLLDATNVINSEISVITNIGLDHCDYLGKTKEEIAKKKAGIIKENQICVTSEKNEGIRNYFSNISKERDSSLIYVNDLLKADIIDQNLDFQRFIVNGVINEKFNSKLLGNHQIQNILTALVVVDILKDKFPRISLESIKKGIEITKLFGRIQIVSKNPLIIVDGAHNLEGIKALAEFVYKIPNKKTLVIGIAKDKDHEKMLNTISKDFKEIITTEGNYKPTNADKLKGIASKYCDNVRSISNVREAVKEAINECSPDDMILITGSMYMISDALNGFYENGIKLVNVDS